MAEITPERQQQLTEEYAQLKEKILDVDHKYSLSYYEPELEFEPSLGLEKLTFTPLTETELQQLAQQEVNPRYLENSVRWTKATLPPKPTCCFPWTDRRKSTAKPCEACRSICGRLQKAAARFGKRRNVALLRRGSRLKKY